MDDWEYMGNTCLEISIDLQIGGGGEGRGGGYTTADCLYPHNYNST